MLEQDIPFLINTDNRTVTQTSLNEEYTLLIENEMITLEQVQYINERAVDYAFLSDEERKQLHLKM